MQEPTTIEKEKLEFDPSLPVINRQDGSERQIVGRTTLGPLTCCEVVERNPEGEFSETEVFVMFDSQVGEVEVPKHTVEMYRRPKEPLRNLPA